MSHQIRHLSFGTYFPGMRNPLDNTSKHSADGAAEARYMIKVVPSAYEALNGSVTCSNLSLSCPPQPLPKPCPPQPLPKPPPKPDPNPVPKPSPKPDPKPKPVPRPKPKPVPTQAA